MIYQLFCSIIYHMDKKCIRSVQGEGYRVKSHLQQYVSYIVVVNVIPGAIRSTRRKTYYIKLYWLHHAMNEI
jgi:hypothetical protein